MARPRKNSVASETSVPDSTQVRNCCHADHNVSEKPILTRRTPSQELGSMYDYLAKVILLGPSGAGKSVPYQSTTTQVSNRSIAPSTQHFS